MKEITYEDIARWSHEDIMHLLDENKRLKEELEKAQSLWHTQKIHICEEWKSRCEKLAKTLRNIQNLLGDGGCEAIKCDGCDFEIGEASTIAKEALASLQAESQGK